MRGTTAKLLRRVAAQRAKGLGARGVPILGALKRSWTKTPRRVRGDIRKDLERELETGK